MISIRDKDYEDLKQIQNALEDMSHCGSLDAAKHAAKLLSKSVDHILDNTHDLMSEARSTAPLTVTFNDLPPKGWTGPI